MLVTVDDFKAAFAMFEAEFVASMKSTLQKFLVGAALAAGGKKLDEMLVPFVNENGLIDTDAIKAIIDAGMKSSGGQVELPINFGVLASIGATPITTTISLADVEKFFTQTLPAVAKPAVQ